MKDFIGQELSVGDVVVVAPKGYRGLIKATVNGFTPKNVKLVYFDHCNRIEDYLVSPNSVVKIPVQS